MADGEDPEAKEIPYSRTGWAPRIGWPSDEVLEAESLLDHGTWVEGKLPDTLYGGKSAAGSIEGTLKVRLTANRLVP